MIAALRPLALLLTCTGFAHAAEPSRLAELLTTGWESGPKAYAAAERHYQALLAERPRDVDAMYAFALVSLQHHRYREADQALDGVLAIDLKHRQARAAKAWLTTLRKQYSTAMVQLAAVDTSSQPDAAHAEYLGRMSGFLAGPAGSAVPEAALAQHEESVLAGFSPKLRDVYSAGRQAVLDEFQKLTGEVAETRAAEEVAQAEEQQAAKQELAQEQSQVESGKSDIESQAAEARKMAEYEVNELDREIIPLEAEFDRLRAEAIPLQAAMNRLDVQIDRLLADAAREEDEVLRAQLRRQADRLAFEHDSYLRRYQVLDARARQVQAQGAALTQRRAAIVAAYEQQMKKLGVEYKGLARREKRIERDKAKTDEPVTGNTGRVHAMRRQATALTTYETFPFEAERQRLMTAPIE